MQISELVIKLIALQKEHGDIEVMISDEDARANYYIELVYFDLDESHINDYPKILIEN